MLEQMGIAAKAASYKLAQLSSREKNQVLEKIADYLEAQTLWQQAMQTQVEARINCYLRWLEYQKAVGKIN